MANQVELYFSTLPAAVSQVNAGRLRALGVTSLKRSSTFPQVPTIAEQGVKDFEVVGWFGMFAPAKTPPAIIARLNRELDAIVRNPEVKERFFAQGLEVVGGTPEQYAQHLRDELALNARIIKAAGIKPD